MTLERLNCEIRLNQVAQGLHNLDDATSWFTSLADTEKRSVLQTLSFMLLQAGATHSDIEAAIAQAGLKASFTPCVMLTRGPLKAQVAKAASLPNAEFDKTFRLLVALYRIADLRRRRKCGRSCSHWWHRDLGSQQVLAEIRQRYETGDL